MLYVNCIVKCLSIKISKMSKEKRCKNKDSKIKKRLPLLYENTLKYSFYFLSYKFV